MSSSDNYEKSFDSRNLHASLETLNPPRLQPQQSDYQGDSKK